MSRSVIATAADEKARGNECVVLAGQLCRGEDDMSYLASNHNVQVIPLRTLRREPSIWDIPTIWVIYRHFLRLGPDVIHTHTAKAGALGRIAAYVYCRAVPAFFLRGHKHCRIIHTFHGNVFRGYFGSLISELIILAERLLARLFTDEIIVLSSSQREEIMRYRIGNPGQYRVSPNKFEPDQFRFCRNKREKHRQRLRIESDEFVVAFVGRLVDVKNPQLFIEAAKLVLAKDELPKIRFLVIGDGPLRSELERLAGSALDHGITFLGHRQELGEFYSAVDLVCITSRNEGVPYVVLESIAAARPVIATDAGGVGPLLGNVASTLTHFEVREHGLLLNGRDTSMLVEAIRWLVESTNNKREAG